MLTIREVSIVVSLFCGTAAWAADCNSNGVQDAVEIEAGSTEDCNSNGIPDECDLNVLVGKEWMLFANDGQFDDRFGFAMDSWGNRAVVGAPANAELGANAGAAYVLKWEGGAWSQEAKLLASDGLPGDMFGFNRSLAIYEDTVAVRVDRSTPGSGAVYVYKYDGSDWVETKLSCQAGESFSGGIDLWEDTLVVGVEDSDGEYAVDVYQFDASLWQYETRIVRQDISTPYYSYGWGVSLYGDVLAVSGSPRYAMSAIVDVYRFDGTEWQLESRVTDPHPDPMDFFGQSHSISEDVLIVGEPRAYADGGYYRGSAVIYRFNGHEWKYDTTLSADPDDRSQGFGWSVAAWGKYVAVSMYEAVAVRSPVYVYLREDIGWSLKAKLSEHFDNGYEEWEYGYAISLSGTKLVVGAPKDEAGGVRSGVAYVFDIGSEDCNSNGVPDTCDVRDGISPDADGNLVPDECQVDYNNNGMPDAAEIARGSAPDCNFNHVIDEYDVSSGASEDTDYDGIPDECQADCNSNGIYDLVEIIMEMIEDCNANDVPDVCEMSDWVEREKFGPEAPLYEQIYGDDVAIFENVVLAIEQLQFNSIVHVLRRDGLRWTEEALWSSLGGALRNGPSVAVWGDVAVVGNPADNTAGNGAGGAHVLRYDGTSWVHEASLYAADAADFAGFGTEVAIEGNRIVVADRPASGFPYRSAYVFDFNGSSWTQQEKLTGTRTGASDDFGYCLSISGDLIAVGDPEEAGTGCAYVFEYNGLAWSQAAKLLTSDAAAGDAVGTSVSIDGDSVAVGAPGDDDLGDGSGSVYVFEYDGMSWAEAGKIVAGDGAAEDAFGTSVSQQDEILVVGSPLDDDNGTDSGSVYAFRPLGPWWKEVDKLLPGDMLDDIKFGSTVALTTNARVAVGAPTDLMNFDSFGAVYYFTLENDCNVNGVMDDCDILGGYSSDFSGDGIPDDCQADCNLNGIEDTAEILAGSSEDCNINDTPDECDIASGESEDIGGDGIPDECQPDCDASGVPDADEIAAGTSVDCDNNGVPDLCDLFDYSEVASLTDPVAVGYNNFGYSADVSDEWAVVAADCGGVACAYVYHFNGLDWLQEDVLMADSAVSDIDLGRVVGISDDVIVLGTRSDDTMGSSAGAAHVFRFDGSNWVHEIKLVPSDGVARSGFGLAVAVAEDRIVIGSGLRDPLRRGAIYIYHYDGSNWGLEQKIESSVLGGGSFGRSVAISGSTIAVGDSTAELGKGRVYIYSRSGSTWSLSQELALPDASGSDYAGSSVSLDNDVLLMSVVGDEDFGSTAVYRNNAGTWVLEDKLRPGDADWDIGFGWSLDVSGDVAVVGAYLEGVDQFDYSGAAYVYRRGESSWLPANKLKAIAGTTSDAFGYAVAISSNGTILAGAPNDRWQTEDPTTAYVFITENDVNGNEIVDACDVLGDLSGDGQVGSEDMFLFVNSMTGPDGFSANKAQNMLDLIRQLADLDSDGDVDLIDFGLLQAGLQL